MTWLDPSAFVWLGLLVAPLLIHLLTGPTRDFRRLALRCLILATAVAALAGPIAATPARRVVAEGRTARALVLDTSGHSDHPRSERQDRLRIADEESRSAFQVTTIETNNPADGIRRAVAWLDSTPPSRQEIVIVSPFQLGAIDPNILGGVPANVGIRLVRVGRLPPTQRISGRAVISRRPNADDAGLFDLHVPIAVVTGAATLAREREEDPVGSIPLDIQAGPSSAAEANDALSEVLAERVFAPGPGRGARLVVVDAQTASGAIGASVVRQRWIADAIAGIAGDAELARASMEIESTVGDGSFAAAPWQPMVIVDGGDGGDGKPLVVGAQADDQLIVASAIPPSAPAMRPLIRSIMRALAPPDPFPGAEVLSIPDTQLRSWERPPGTPSAERIQRPGRQRRPGDDDRRWAWLVVIGLVMVDGWGRAVPHMLLRFAAIAIAAVAAIDPAVAVQGRINPRVAVVVQQGPTLELPAAEGSGSRRALAERLRDQLVASLQSSFDVSRDYDAGTAAAVVIGDRYAPEPAPQTLPIVTVDVGAPLSPNVRLLRVDSSRGSEAVQLTVDLEATGMAGQTSIVTARVSDSEVGRTSHAWTAERQRWRGSIPLPSALDDAAVVRVEAQPIAIERTTLDNAADAVIPFRPDDAGSSPVAVATVSISPAPLAPLERAELHVILPPSEQTSDPDTDVVIHARTAEGHPIRLWPDVGRGVFRGTFIAPATAGPSRVEVAIGPDGARAVSRSFVVSQDVRRPLPAETPGALSLLAAAHQGIHVTPDRLAEIGAFLQAIVAPTGPVERRPMRSFWVVVLFTACLSIEWWMRRRAGFR